MTNGLKQTTHALQVLEQRYPPRAVPAGAEVTRVAPSPTGKPHIGTALQAIIDYALARQTTGCFILRIEDTDRIRLYPGAVEEIIDALSWLGVPPDEGPAQRGFYGPYVESERLDIYHAVANWLLDHGYAYHCFCTPQRLAELRQRQTANKEPTGYDGLCRHLSPQEVEQRLTAGEGSAVRLAMPQSGTIVYDDAMRGPIEWNASLLDDHIILKSDGFPTYHLAAVVDDHFMRVTTVVRGEEWLSSTPRHIVLYHYLGWQSPRIVHTNVLRDAQGRKLSKRSGDTSISWYRAQGYSAEAFRNFLTRIIWPHPDGKDVYPFEDFIRGLSLPDLPTSAPVANPTLLDFISGEWLRMNTPSQLYDQTTGWLRWLLEEYTADGMLFQVQRKNERLDVPVSRGELEAFQHAFVADRAYSEQVLGLEPERYHKLGDVVLQAALFFPQLFRPASAEFLLEATKLDRDVALAILRDYRVRIAGDEPQEAWEHQVDHIVQERGLKRGAVFMLLRVAVTASKQTPPLYAIICVLGPQEVQRRVELAERILEPA